MDTFNSLVNADLRSLNPNGGVVAITTYWRPRLSDPNPEQPGERLSLLTYIHTAADAPCPCGSGNSFGACCQLLPYWRPVCPNPDMQSYSLLHPQSASFTNISADAVYAFLQDDERLYCVEDSPQRAFWTYWGDPAFDAPPYGTLCFGDFELQGNHTLLVTALSDTRMEVLLDLLRPLKLETPKMQLDPFPRMEKPGRIRLKQKRRRRR
jgi:hypothetical protein